MVQVHVLRVMVVAVVVVVEWRCFGFGSWWWCSDRH
jgi:hypothetical protein